MARAFARVPSQEALLAGAKKLQFKPSDQLTETGLGLGGFPLATQTSAMEEDEEGEQTVFEMRAKLFALDKDEYRVQGVGQFRVRENVQSRKRRMIMRTDSTGLVSLNSWIIHPRSSLSPAQNGSDNAQLAPRQDKRSVILFAMEDNRPKQFLLRVKTEQDAEALLKALL